MPKPKSPTVPFKPFPRPSPSHTKKPPSTDPPIPTPPASVPEHPLSPRDTTPLIIYGNVQPNPSTVQPMSVGEGSDHEEPEEEEEDDDIVMPTMAAPIPAPADKQEDDVVIATAPAPQQPPPPLSSLQSSVPRSPPPRYTPPAVTPLRSAPDVVRRLQDTDSESEAESEDDDVVQPMRREPPMRVSLADAMAAPPKPAPRPTKRLEVPLPSKLVSNNQYRIYRPDKIPEYEFFNERTAEEQLTPADMFQAVSFYSEKCQRLHQICRSLKPPTFETNGRTDTPSLARMKADRYEERVNVHKRAADIGTFIFIIIGGIEYVVTRWLGVKVTGLFKLQMANKAEYYDALVSMGENVMGWLQGSVSPIWRMLFVFIVSLVALVAINYLIDYLLPEQYRGRAHDFKQTGIKYIQDMASMFMGYQNDESNGSAGETGNTILNFLSGLFGVNSGPSAGPFGGMGGAAPSPAAARPAGPPHHD